MTLTLTLAKELTLMLLELDTKSVLVSLRTMLELLLVLELLPLLYLLLKLCHWGVDLLCLRYLLLLLVRTVSSSD